MTFAINYKPDVPSLPLDPAPRYVFTAHIETRLDDAATESRSLPNTCTDGSPEQCKVDKRCWQPPYLAKIEDNQSLRGIDGKIARVHIRLGEHQQFASDTVSAKLGSRRRIIKTA